jgi:hypothetical protein
MRNGIITSEQYTARMAKINDSFSKLDETSKKLVLAVIFKNFDEKTQKALTGISSLGGNMQILAVQALSAGVAMTGFMRTLDLLAKSKDAINKNTDPREVAAFNRAVGKTEKDLKAAIDAVVIATKKANDAEKDRGKTGKETGFNLIKELQKNIEAINNQRKAFVSMRKAGIDAATAMELAGNPEMAKALISAAQQGGKAWEEATKKIKEYTEAQKLLERTLVASAQRGDYELARLNMAQKYLDLQEHLIDIQNSVELKEYNDRLEEQSELLSNINREIEKITEKSISPLEKQIRANNYALEEIAAQEDEINEKYDKQFEALDRIKAINQDINKIQQQRLSIADALTQGDISQAAQLVAQARQDRSSDDINRRSLEEERKIRLGLLGREAIEKNNKKLQLEISRIKRDQIDALDDEKFAIQSNINSINFQRESLEKLITKQKESLFVFGMTKVEIDNAAKALDLAKNAGIDINDKNFLNNVLKAATGDSFALSAALIQVAKDAKAALDDLEKLRKEQIDGATRTKTQGEDLTVSSTTKNYNVIPKDNIIDLDTKPTAEKEYQDAFTFLPKEAPATNYAIVTEAIKAAESITTTSLANMNLYGGGVGAYSVMALAGGGMVKPKYFANGNFARGTDTIPAMLTPGEYVVRKNAVDNFGVNNLNKINDGAYDGGAVYNYSLSVNVKSDANPNDIARTVISQIKQIDSQRIRNQR